MHDITEPIERTDDMPIVAIISRHDETPATKDEAERIAAEAGARIEWAEDEANGMWGITIPAWAMALMEAEGHLDITTASGIIAAEMP